MKEFLLREWKEKYGFSEKLLKAFENVPRELFVREDDFGRAYGDYPLPIGYGQTISQPTTVMIMINALELKPTDKVLEIGAGSGYCAALMSKLAREVVSVEIITELVELARSNLRKAGIKNVIVVEGDGSLGYGKKAPYDKVMVTAACPKIPKPLIEQLKPDGILVAPVGAYSQRMIRIKNGKKEDLGSFVFVPLRGKHGF
ncbi:protein-L-isoaspartate(D-aspartate) O-methyltransferase [Candidatus Woesearchaeota archaeon]|nr:MAG: protein-L-isoaspartate(D-aspartate) O-methyltransferase [Candidatus Woesearchaeota archaeon]